MLPGQTWGPLGLDSLLMSLTFIKSNHLPVISGVGQHTTTLLGRWGSRVLGSRIFGSGLLY